MAHRLIQQAMGFGMGAGVRMVSAVRNTPRAMGIMGSRMGRRTGMMSNMFRNNRPGFGAAMNRMGGFVGTTSLAGAGLGMMGNMGANFINDPSTRNFGGMMRAGFRGAMFGGAMGAGMGAGGLLAGGRRSMGGQAFRTAMGRARPGLIGRMGRRGTTLNDFTPI